MKKLFLVLLAAHISFTAAPQKLHTTEAYIGEAFDLAIGTVKHNIKDSTINAGGTDKEVRTEDIAINAWNACSLLWPGITGHSLWKATEDQRLIAGDKMIWVVAAYNQYLINNDQDFLKQAYTASANTMAESENSAYDKKSGLFMGPAVCNDGISGYEEPIFNKDIHNSDILSFPAHKTIKCLSTNCIYYEAYQCLEKMAMILGDQKTANSYGKKAYELKIKIRRNFYDGSKNRLVFLIDQNGDEHKFQETLGISFAVMFDIVTKKEAQKLISNAHVTQYGAPAIFPSFKRFSPENPGSYNVMIWPFVNGFWVDACYTAGDSDQVEAGIKNLANLAVVKSGNVFYEIYDPIDGKPGGGFRNGSDAEPDTLSERTWSATGYLRMIFRGMLGMGFTTDYMELKPDFAVMDRLGFTELEELPYREGFVTIRKSSTGTTLKEIRIDGQQVFRDIRITPPASGKTTVVELIF